MFKNTTVLRDSLKENSAKTIWHSLPQEEIYKLLESNNAGLSQAEAELRLTKNGANKLTPQVDRGVIKRFLSQFNNILIYLLLGSGTIAWMVGEWVDSLVIFFVILANAIIGFIQEGKAEKALNSIRNLLTPQATVCRDKKTQVIPSELLVAGDIVLLESGDKVPADLRLLNIKNLHIDESMLTGESIPVRKDCHLCQVDMTLADRHNVAYSGTLVTSGTALGIVVATGDNTELGRINQLLTTNQHLTTPLLKQIAVFSRWLTLSIILVAALIFAYGWYVNHTPVAELFMSVVSLAVAAIPEGLPTIMTITLAIGVQQMAKQNAIIRRLPAVETLGSVSVICTDKTGTLTRNEMTVKSIYTEGNSFVVEGAGYNPNEGRIKLADDMIEVKTYPALDLLIKVGALCNTALVFQKQGAWQIQGDPTEAALITVALKAGFSIEQLEHDFSRIDTIPFESAYSYMATLHKSDVERLIFVKGAPEIILNLSQSQFERDLIVPIEVENWSQQIHKLAACGQRVMAMAYKKANDKQHELTHSDLETGLIFLGLVGMADPPRSEAYAAVSICHKAGISVKMITGDHAVTAMCIAEQLGIGHGLVLRGEEIDEMSDEALKTAVNHVDVFARISPESKLRLVGALQAMNHIVAMTGDGVNDAPALQAANVGIAMGKKGTEVAKEASEMVLADDNFATIAKAVEEGRGIYDNLKKAILFILPTGVAEGLMVAVAILLGEELPITPVQILWVNTVTEISLSLALAFEKPEGNVMARKPKAVDEPLLSGLIIWRLALVSLMMVAGTYLLFHWAHNLTGSIDQARTVALNTLVMYEIVYIFNSRYLMASVLNWKGFFGNQWIWLAVAGLIIAQVSLTYYPPMQALFDTKGFAGHFWWKILGVALSLFVVVELEKYVLRAIFPKLRKTKKSMV